MRIVHLDIETSPNTVYTWGLFKQNVGINQIVDPGRTICWAAKWHGKNKIHFDSEHESTHRAMVKGIWSLMNEADAVCHYNGARFDVPTLNKEFLKYSLQPPAPYKQIDLLKVVRKQFKHTSNKLDYISQQLGIGEKVKHMGHDLWRGCMDGDESAWRLMKKYNIHDVRLLETLYTRLLPWITTHPNYALYTDTDRPVCTNCGGEKVHRRGIERTKTQQYRRFQCIECRTWMRSRMNITPAEKRPNVLVQVP